MGSWKGQIGEEMVYRWLEAKVEEDKRISEQERTRQEQTRLEQRKIEQQMLQEAMRAGMSPNLIPLMFATATGNTGLKGYGQEWAREQVGDLFNHYREVGGRDGHHQLMPAASQPELRREKRSVAQAHRGSVEGPSPMSQQPPVSLMHTMAPPGAPQSGGPPQARELPPFSVQQFQPPLSVNTSSRQASVSQPSGHHGPAQGHAPSGPSGQRGSLPRINMSEMQLHQPPPFQVAPQQPSSQYPPPSSTSESSSGSNFIFFHHYVPPGQQGSSGSGQRSSPPRSLDPPFAHQANSHGAENATSPRKRKSTSTQPQQPPPPTTTTQPQAFSPMQAVTTPGGRRAHSRQRSESTSAVRGPDHYGRHHHRSHRRSEVGYIPPDGPSQSDRDTRASISGVSESQNRPPILPGIGSHTFIQEHHAPPQQRSHQAHSHRSGSLSQADQSNQPLPPISVQSDPREPQPQYSSQRPMSAGPEMQRPHQFQSLPPRDEPHHHRTRPGSRDEGPHNA